MKINVNNTAALEEVLAPTAKLKRGFSPQEVINIAYYSEYHLIRLGIPKNKRKGVIRHYGSDGPSAVSYGWTATWVELVLERGSDDWFLTSVEKVVRYPKEKGNNSYRLSTNQTEIAIRAFLKRNNIKEAE